MKHYRRLRLLVGGLVLLLLVLSACQDSNQGPDAENVDLKEGQVVNVIDGDTIDVEIGGERYRVRYIGVNTPERDEPCYQAASDANRALVLGQSVKLERDVSATDPYVRLLRYVYVGDTFVNEVLVRDGFAEAVLYPPDDRHYQTFLALERQAAQANRGCHPTGIFDDGSVTR